MKKENIEQMHTRHKEEVSILQWNCEHANVSEWRKYQWAPGHTFGRVKCCNNCGKIIEQQPTHEQMKLVVHKVGTEDKPGT